jgi:hypothetical protein
MLYSILLKYRDREYSWSGHPGGINVNDGVKTSTRTPSFPATTVRLFLREFSLDMSAVFESPAGRRQWLETDR